MTGPSRTLARRPRHSTPQAERRVVRLLDLLWRITREPHTWTRALLAASYGVSERQITKDLAVLRSALGCDLRHTQQGYYLGPGSSVVLHTPIAPPWPCADVQR